MDLLLPRHRRADKEGIATRWLVDLREEHRRQLAPKPIRCAMARTPGARRIAAYAADQTMPLASRWRLAILNVTAGATSLWLRAFRKAQRSALQLLGKEGLARTAPRVRHSSPCERCKEPLAVWLFGCRSGGQIGYDLSIDSLTAAFSAPLH
jgi:hypothetical protein